MENSGIWEFIQYKDFRVLRRRIWLLGHEEEVLLDSETAYKDSKNTKKKMGSTKNLFIVLMFVFVVGAVSVGVGFSLYHCLSKQHIGGLGGEVEKTSGK